MFKNKPFHEGEIAVQKRTKQILAAKMNALAISDKLPRGASQFMAQLQMVVIGSMDLNGRIWSSIIFGEQSFFYAKDTQHLYFNKENSGLLDDDPLLDNIKNNTQVGLLFIDLGSRTRLRVNGQVQSLSVKGFTIEIVQAYPNCPKYIQRRKLTVSAKANNTQEKESEMGTVLGINQQILIQQADTCFVASSHPDHGIDCSHRGGQSGFVQVKNNKCLRMPDYAGNSLFNTLGNFHSYPFAGLVFIDFEKQRVLQLTGKVKILWDLEDFDNVSGGTRRFWDFEIESWHESPIPFSVSWDYLDASPFNPSLSPTLLKESLSLCVKKITQLTPRIKSFVLTNIEHNNLPAFEPGAHLQITILNNKGQAFIRQYSLISDYTDTTSYEIAVLEETQGRGGSLAMNNNVRVGDVLQVTPPQNDFPMVENVKHSVLIAGGIGITPIISMLRKLSAEKQSFEVHYVARTYMDFVLPDVIKVLAGDKLYSYTSEKSEGKTLNLQSLLAATLDANTHIYVCGPSGMIEAVRTISKKTSWSPEQIHFESFGVKNLVGDKPISVHLSQSKKTIQVPANQSILESLLETGLNVPHQCKRGECSVCITTVLGGEPEHHDTCLSYEQRKSSMCICVSRAIGDSLILEL